MRIDRKHRSGAEFARLDYATTDDGARRLRMELHGEIDIADLAHVLATLDEVTALPPCDVTVDLTAVTFLGSTGLRLIAGLHKHTVTAGHELRLTNPASIVRRALNVCGFDQIMTVAPR